MFQMEVMVQLSAIVQLNIGSANAASFQIAVKVSGAYENNPWSTLSQCIVTVSKPVPGGYIVGGGNLLNSNSSGYVKGANGQLTGFQFDVQFNNKLTNPQGKAMIYISSYNKPDGTLDNKLPYLYHYNQCDFTIEYNAPKSAV